MWGQRNRASGDHCEGHETSFLQGQQRRLPVVVDHVTKEQAAMDQGVLYRLPPEGHEFPPAYSEEARPARIHAMKVDSFICEPTKTFRSGSLSAANSVSVRDRIALFSQPGATPTQSARAQVSSCNTLPRSLCNPERTVTTTKSIDMTDRKHPAPLNRWHSATSLLTPTERRSSYVSTYPETQLLRRPGYERSSSSSTLLSSFLQERTSAASKLKGLIVPEGPTKQTTANSPLPLIGPSASWRPAPLVPTSFQLSHSKPVTPPVPERPILVSTVRSTTPVSPPPPLPPTSPPPLPPNVSETGSPKTSPIMLENDLVSPPSIADSAKPFRNPIERLDSLLGTHILPSDMKSLSSPDNSPPDSGPNSINSGINQHINTSKSSLSPPPALSTTTPRTNSTPNSVESSSSRSRFWSLHDESDDDSNSVISLRTEDSRQTADDSLSDADSLHQERSEFRPRRLSQQRTVLSSTITTVATKQTTDSVSQFRALAERWEARSLENTSPVVSTSRMSVTSSTTNINTSFPYQSSTNPRIPKNGTETIKLPPSLQPRSALQDCKSVLPLLERSLSSTDLVESRLQKTSRSVSISDIRKSFETKKQVVEHKRFSSMDSTASDSGVGTPGGLYGSTSSLHAGNQSHGVDGFGSGTSLASDDCCLNSSPTAAPLPTTNQIILEEAASLLKVESEELQAECQFETITLQKDIPQGSVGITLAGGADYEVKEITVHKVITGGLADRDGRLQKGDHILSINGQTLQGLTHRQALDLLKAHRHEVILVISKHGAIQNCSEVQTTRTRFSSLDKANKTSRIASEEPKGANPTIPLTTPSAVKGQEAYQLPPGAVQLQLVKDGAGLGFSLDGGQGSPFGDRPLTVKRVFKGGAADHEGHLSVGDQVLFIGHQSVSSMTRTEAWNYMKKLADGPVTLTIRPLVDNTLPN